MILTLMLPDHLNDLLEDASVTFYISLWIEFHCAQLTSHEPFCVLVVTSSLQLNIDLKLATVFCAKRKTFGSSYLQVKSLGSNTVFLFFSHSEIRDYIEIFNNTHALKSIQ